MDTHLEQNTKDEPMEIGQVTSINPFTIKIGDLCLYSSYLYISKYMFAWDENVIITNSDNTTSTISIHHPSKVNVGDYVGLYGLEWNDIGKTYQRYYVLNIIM
jgi:hypothetical protein